MCAVVVVSGLYFGVFVSVVFLSDISKKKFVWGLLIALRKNKQINTLSDSTLDDSALCQELCTSMPSSRVCAQF